MAGESGVDAVATVRESARFPDGPTVVALSGGADSSVCAWAAVDSGASVRAVFVHHGFPESAEMAAAARAVAAHIDIELDEVSVTIPDGPSPEDQARRVRHRALEESLKPDETLLSGHTADDQAETLLANLVRGAGAGGIAGIPRRRGRWERPLLDVDRATVRRAAESLQLPFADDPTNESLGPRRNRIRHEVIPGLREFNPEVVAALGRAAGHAAIDSELIDRRAARVPLVDAGGTVKVPAAALIALPPAVAARVARRALRAARGPYPGTSDEVAAVIAAASGAAATLSGELQVQREGPWVVLGGAPPSPTGDVPLVVPGTTRFWAGEIEAEPAGERRPLGPQVTVVDPAESLVITTAAADERVSIGQGSKTVGDALSEAGVPPRLRPQWPCVTGDGIILWIVGVRAAPAPAAGVLLRARLEEL